MQGKQSRLAGAIAVICALGCAGAPKRLEPRAPPPKARPPVDVPRAPLAEGYGRVVLHSTDEQLKLTARGDTAFVPPGQHVAPTRSGELCVTPCVVDLPAGQYKLFMVSADGSYEHGDTDQLTVREGLNYYVRAPGRFEPPQWLHVIPSIIVIAGTLLVVTGVTIASSPTSDQQTTGLALVGAGVGIGVAGGIMAYDQGRGSTQEGATTAWWEPLQ
jgi:hypothetical protein